MHTFHNTHSAAYHRRSLNSIAFENCRRAPVGSCQIWDLWLLVQNCANRDIRAVKPSIDFFWNMSLRETYDRGDSSCLMWASSSCSVGAWVLPCYSGTRCGACYTCAVFTWGQRFVVNSSIISADPWPPSNVASVLGSGSLRCANYKTAEFVCITPEPRRLRLRESYW